MLGYNPCSIYDLNSEKSTKLRPFKSINITNKKKVITIKIGYIEIKRLVDLMDLEITI